MKWKFFIVIVSSFVLPVSGFGMTYYAAVDGMDSNSGTDPQSPWTLQTAINVAVAGDEIQIKGGDFNLVNTLLLSASGTGTLPITIKPYNNETVTLAAVDSANSQLDYAVMIKNTTNSQQPWLLQDLKIKGGKIAAVKIASKYVSLENFQFEQYAGQYVEIDEDVALYVTVTLKNDSNANTSILNTTNNNTVQSQQSASSNTGAQSTDDSGEPSGESGGGGGCSVHNGQVDIGQLLNLFLIIIFFYMRKLWLLLNRPRQ